MKKHIRNRNVFLDANIILDYLLPRKHHSMHATSFFDKAPKFSVILYVCSFTFAIVYHHLRKNKMPHNIALTHLEKLLQKVICLPVSDIIIQQALNSEFRDFEDALQYHCALQVPECDAIITRNPIDFALSSVFVVSPQKFSFQ